MDQKQKILLGAYLHAAGKLLGYFLILTLLVIIYNIIINFLLRNPEILVGEGSSSVFLLGVLIIFVILSKMSAKEYQDKIGDLEATNYSMKTCPLCDSELFLGKCWQKCGVQWEMTEVQKEAAEQKSNKKQRTKKLSGE